MSIHPEYAHWGLVYSKHTMSSITPSMCGTYDVLHHTRVHDDITVHPVTMTSLRVLASRHGHVHWDWHCWGRNRLTTARGELVDNFEHWQIHAPNNNTAYELLAQVPLTFHITCHSHKSTKSMHLPGIKNNTINLLCKLHIWIQYRWDINNSTHKVSTQQIEHN